MSDAFPPFQQPAPMFESPLAQPAPKRRGRPPKNTAAAPAAKPARKPRAPNGPAAPPAEPRTLTELIFGVDANAARVLEEVVHSIQTLPDDARKGLIAALQRIFP
jgi:hypothetical protein